MLIMAITSKMNTLGVPLQAANVVATSRKEIGHWRVAFSLLANAKVSAQSFM